jgi:hypothetical protein
VAFGGEGDLFEERADITFFPVEARREGEFAAHSNLEKKL